MTPPIRTLKTAGQIMAVTATAALLVLAAGQPAFAQGAPEGDHPQGAEPEHKEAPAAHPPEARPAPAAHPAEHAAPAQHPEAAHPASHAEEHAAPAARSEEHTAPAQHPEGHTAPAARPEEHAAPHTEQHTAPRPEAGHPQAAPQAHPEAGHPAAAQPHPNYHVAPQATAKIRDHFRGSFAHVDRAHRPHFEIGGYFPRDVVTYVQPVPREYWGDLPPPPPGYIVGYYDGYLIVYDPATFYIVEVVDLMD